MATRLPAARRGTPRALPRHVTSPVLVGRRSELIWLGEALARVSDNGRAAMLIGGGAGVGKSRLVGEFTATAAAHARVLRGRCPELGPVGLPFAPFTDVLRTLVGEFGADGVGALLSSEQAGPGGCELIRLLPELGEPVPGGSPREARARLFVEMLSLLETLACRRPVVLVIEDAHWADESTRDLLSFLIDNQRAMERVLIIVTFRSDELHRGHPLPSLLGRLGRLDWVQRIELSGLDRGESAELIAHIMAGDPAAGLVDRVFGRTAGNPLCVEQLVCCDREPAVTPRDLMLAGVQRLPEPTQDVLRTASVGGQRAGRALLCAVTGLTPAELGETLRPAVDAGVIIAAEGTYGFRHALISEALHQDLLPGEHTAMHQQFAVALEADPSLVPPGRAAIELAQHWYHAHDPARSLAGAWQAAAAAGRTLACAEQLAMLTRVLELWHSVPGAEWLTGTGHAQVLAQAAVAATAAGESQLGESLAAAARRESNADLDCDPVRSRPNAQRTRCRRGWLTTKPRAALAAE
ncbi:MAG TPA: AAA family ATPase [Streptosporangiaceae bacterium]|jgi:predicted ATPase